MLKKWTAQQKRPMKLPLASLMVVSFFSLMPPTAEAIEHRDVYVPKYEALTKTVSVMASSTLRGYADCAAGEDDCNFAAQSIDDQFSFLDAAGDYAIYGDNYHGLSLAGYPLHIDDDMWEPYFKSNGDSSAAHVQGFVQTNEVEGEWFFAFSHNGYLKGTDSKAVDEEKPGSISFARKWPNREKWIDYVFERPVVHPSSLAQIGKYVLWVERPKGVSRLHVMDVTMLSRYASCPEPCVVSPDDYDLQIPSLEIDDLGHGADIGTGGGGVGIARLSTGDYLLAVGNFGGFDEARSDVQVVLVKLTGSLDAPSEMSYEYITTLDFSCPACDHRIAHKQDYVVSPTGGRYPIDVFPTRDENLSLFTDDEGRIFLYLPSSEHGDYPEGTARLFFYELSISSLISKWSVSAVNSAYVETPSYKKQGAFFYGGTSARVDSAGVLRIMASELKPSTSDMKLHYFMHPCSGSSRVFNQDGTACNTP